MKKGFTLIELLAVIVILAIIALIAVPIIMGVIEENRKAALKSSAYGLIRSAEVVFSVRQLNSEQPGIMEFQFLDFSQTSNVGELLNFKGKSPKTGGVLVNELGAVAVAISDGKYCAYRTERQTVVELDERLEESCISTFANEYTDLSGASKPELYQGLLPVYYDENAATSSKWIKADVYEEWYSYEETKKRWANAVLVTESTRQFYLQSKPGEPIEESDILGYFVWIPRYRYQLFNVERASLVSPYPVVEVQFENQTEPGYTKEENTENGQWLTHPAFTFGLENEVNGFWVAKFETTGTDDEPTILPGFSSLRGQNVSDAFATAKKLTQTSLYGLTSVANPHLIKNMEWGAIAYLTKSKYGKETELWINNSSTYLTGCAGNSQQAAAYSGCQNAYGTENGKQASTTGNAYGVYDMSGGAWERVMGYNTASLGSSGFTVLPDAKYYDAYPSGTTMNTNADYLRSLLGDATGESRGWNPTFNLMVNTFNPWFSRGAGFASVSNGHIMAFAAASGEGFSTTSFRITIAKD